MDTAIIVAIIGIIGNLLVILVNLIITQFQTKKLEKNKQADSIKSELKIEINNFRKEYDKTYLTDFLSELESGVTKSEIQKERAHEIYSEYTDELKGNSYIHTKWSDLEKKGLL